MNVKETKIGEWTFRIGE